MSVLHKEYIITMPYGNKWSVPVLHIALNRAEYFQDEYGGDVEKSLLQDTKPLFEQNEYMIHDWARNNMNWCDVSSVATLVKTATVDYDAGWACGEYEIKE